MTTPDLFTTDPIDHLAAADTTTMPGNFVAIYTLHSFVGVNLNADKDGAPKRMIYGGTERMRVSSQARIRAARTWAREYLSNHQQGRRTRGLPRLIGAILQDRYGHDPAPSEVTAAAIVSATGLGINWSHPQHSDVVVLVPSLAAAQLAALAHDNWDALGPARDAAQGFIDKAMKSSRGQRGGNAPSVAAASHGQDADGVREDTVSVEAGKTAKGKDAIDSGVFPAELRRAALAAFDAAGNVEIALFGRMFASIPGCRLTSAAQVAEAFSADCMDEILDDFVAVDDCPDEDIFGAAMLGTRHLASGVLYGYAALDRRALRKSLSSCHDVEGAARMGEKVWLAAMERAIPRGRRSRTGSNVLPSLVVVLTTDTPIDAAQAFEEAIPAPASVAAGVQLLRYLGQIHHHAPFRDGIVRWITPHEVDLSVVPEPLSLVGV